MKIRKLFFTVLFIFLVVGCQQPEATPTLAPPTALPTEVAAATNTVAPTVTLPPNPTPVPAAATFTPIPTSTQPPEPTITPTVEAIPVWLLTEEDFGEDRSWLTGELVTDPAVLLRRPIAVKISNSPPNFVDPNLASVKPTSSLSMSPKAQLPASPPSSRAKCLKKWGQSAAVVSSMLSYPPCTMRPLPTLAAVSAYPKNFSPPISALAFYAPTNQATIEQVKTNPWNIPFMGFLKVSGNR